jgi:hypothetical protein
MRGERELLDAEFVGPERRLKVLVRDEVIKLGVL